MRSTTFDSARSRFVGCFGVLLLLLAAAGCGSGEGTVSGRVLYNGKPLPAGRVTFRPADPRQNSVSAELDEQGAYQVVLPTGEVKVSVDNREWEPPPAAITGRMPPGLPPDVQKALGGGRPDQPPPKPPENAPRRSTGRYVKIPDRYYAIETSGLQFTVARGEQKHDLELKE
jgi:hypothetical protein